MRQLHKIAEQAKREAIYDAVQKLATWPTCDGDIKRLQGREDYRLLVGDYRVVFEIDQRGKPIIVTISQVSKRNERIY
ncbi:type II toxin-antitoxin system RelE/ParE family toxin [Rugamonas sp. A1-17]|nr:type II toxin-antitoxin system RelE/ParE family toxin [Rugamonas sp. A1-17]